MAMVLETRIDPQEERRFRETTRELGTTPGDAVKVFIEAFNRNRGFPFEPNPVSIEVFNDEDDATDFVNDLALRMVDEAR